jgi:hypothetical protein
MCDRRMAYLRHCLFTSFNALSHIPIFHTRLGTWGVFARWSSRKIRCGTNSLGVARIAHSRPTRTGGQVESLFEKPLQQLGNPMRHLELGGANLTPKGGTELGLRLTARGCGQGTCTIHQGTPFFYFSIFSPMHIFL